jgi:hypothetical protein|tara:strand:+ start:535 stop:675 length:141 start_codon:yes stop_codon:yes gene_type:complete
MPNVSNKGRLSENQDGTSRLKKPVSVAAGVKHLKITMTLPDEIEKQ